MELVSQGYEAKLLSFNVITVNGRGTVWLD